MSTDQTAPLPANATLAGVRGTVEPAETAPGAAGAAVAGATSAATGPTVDPVGDHARGPIGDQPVGDHAAGSIGDQPADSLGENTASRGDDAASLSNDTASRGDDTASLDDRPAGAVDEQVAPAVTVPSGEPARSASSSWQAEASGKLVAMSFPGARRIAGWLFWVIFPLLCIAAIHTSVTNVIHHVGNKPTGIRGTFVVQPRSCSQGFCSFGGLFTSDDHTIKNLPLLGDPRWHTADVLRVTYDPRSVEVTALPGHWDPTPSVMAAIGALTYLVLLGYFVRERRRSGRSWRRLTSNA